MRSRSETGRPLAWPRLALGAWCLTGLAACSGAAVGPARHEGLFCVVASLPHDTLAFTEGLVFHDGWLFESTGGLEYSAVQKIEPQTGLVVQRHRLPRDFVGEGLAVVGSKLIQLTWRSGVAFEYDVETLSPIRTLRYEGEGWGLCYDGRSLRMTNGSDTLYARDPVSFRITERTPVRMKGLGVGQLNEIECVGHIVYANVFRANHILVIQGETGEVLRQLPGESLYWAAGIAPTGIPSINGIAYDPDRDAFYVTGKLWPRILKVTIDPGPRSAR